MWGPGCTGSPGWLGVQEAKSKGASGVNQLCPSAGSRASWNEAFFSHGHRLAKLPAQAPRTQAPGAAHEPALVFQF